MSQFKFGPKNSLWSHSGQRTSAPLNGRSNDYIYKK